VHTTGAPDTRPSVVNRAFRRARRTLGATPPSPENSRRKTELRPYFTSLGQFAVKTVRL
jgi:hypothetical protein